MIVYFADRQLTIVGQASTDLPEGLIVVDDNKTEEIDTGIAVFECKISFDKGTRAMVESCTECGNYVLCSHDDEHKLYTIIDTELDTEKQEVYIYAEDDGMDLLNEIVGAYAADKAYSIAHYINKYAANAGFEIGINEVSTLSRKLSWEGESTATERIASIATQFGGCEISFSFEVDGLNVAKKYINIYKERGKDVGITLRVGEEVDRIVTTKSIANIATALQCTGGTPEDENLDDDIEPVAITLNGYEYDDGDFYVDTDGVLKSRKAFERWRRFLWKTANAQQSGGHIVKPYSYDTLSQSTLCSHAITELKKIRDMEINYEVEISKLPANVKIGDRVNIVDDEGEFYVSARILQLESSVANAEHKAIIGEYLIKSSGIHQKVTDLAAQFAAEAKARIEAVNTALDAKRAAIQAAGTAQRMAGTALDAAEIATARADAAGNAATSAQGDAQTAVNETLSTKEETNERITMTETVVQRLSNAIASLVIDENGESLMIPTDNGWTFSMKETNEAVSELSSGLEELLREASSTQAAVDVLQQALVDHGKTLDYIAVKVYEGEPCIELGESDSAFKLLVTNTRIMFMNGSKVPTYINTNGLVTQNIEVKGEIVQGGYVQLNTADGGWGVLWKGVSG